MTAHHDGLVRWRKTLAVERQTKLAELARLREHATIEIREGREYRVVRIPDKYGERGGKVWNA